MTSECDEEDFAKYGSPLDPLDEDAIAKKRAMTVEDQVAKDKLGRRRFHGAFTGGFSAGFFNTVGSLEGWKPSQFKSSRSSKSKAQYQRAEDFMDEEDIDEFGIAPKVLRPTGDYSAGPSRKRSMMQFSDGPIPGIPVLRTLLEPVKETIGMRLLVRMGWRPGQGVGPRLSKSEKSVSKKIQKQDKLYGCALPNQDDPPREEAMEDSDVDEEIDSDVTFAPDDYEPYVVRPKDDCFGLGYSGLDRRPVLSSHVNLFGPDGPSLVMQEKKKKVSIRGQAFGVGAFEKDDEDIYAKEDMSQYDFALDTPKMLAEKRQQERNARVPLPSSMSDVLEGFVVSSCALVRKKYPPPLLPQGFSACHHTRPSRFSASTVTGGHSARLSAAERAVIVDEPSTLPQAREAVEVEKITATPSLSATQTGEPVEVERTSDTFRPFVADPAKQQRYESFLSLTKTGQSEKLRDLQPLTMTEWEQEREKAEFEQAARLSASFSDRFVSASQPESAPPATSVGTDKEVLTNAAKLKMFGRLTRTVAEWQPHTVLCKRFNIPQPRESGSMKPKTSRPKFSVFNFLDAAPFNVQATSTENNSSSERVSVVTAKTVLPTVPPDADKESTTVEDDPLEQLVSSTSKMDLYKAIFLSSSEESDGDDENPSSTVVQTQITNNSTATAVNVLRNTSPPRGIFANLDFDNLLKKPSKTTLQETNVQEADVLRNTSPGRGIFANLNTNTHDKQEQITDSVSKEVTESPDPSTPVNSKPSSQPHPDSSVMYGPSLPNNIPRPAPRVGDHVSIDDSSASDEDWVEISSSTESASNRHSSKKKHSKKSHRKNQKHRGKKHKHKKKKK